jgi:hypothetical protein
MQITNQYSVYEEFIKNNHPVGVMIESNRPGDEFQKRLDQLLTKVDNTVLVYNPNYEEMLNIKAEVATNLFGNKPKMSVQDFTTLRNDTVDLLFIQNSLPYMDLVRDWYHSEVSKITIEKMDALSFVRGEYGIIVYLHLFVKEKPDYVVGCHNIMRYNLLCDEIVKKYGIDFELPFDKSSIT